MNLYKQKKNEPSSTPITTNSNYLETFENQKSNKSLMQHSSTTDTYNINNTMNISKTNLTSTSTATQMTPKTSTIPNTKQNLNIIHLNKDLKQPHTTSKSPELKPTDKKIPLKGMNIIPIRQQTTADKISPRNVITKTATNFGINSSPKGSSFIEVSCKY
jgi:hypothetical protein